MENTKMSSKLLSWVWFGIAIIALILFMYYQSQRNKALAPTTADENATSTDEMATDEMPAINLTGAVTNAGATETAQPSTASGPKQERNAGYVTSVYVAKDKVWMGIDFASVYLGAENMVTNGSKEVMTFNTAPEVKIMVNGEIISLTDFMAKFNDSAMYHDTLFRFTLGKDSQIYGVEEIKL